MNTRTNVVSRAVLVALGVVGVAGAALADHARVAVRYDRGYRDSDYARVVDVDPIIRRVRVSRPAEECWNEDRPVYNRSGTVARSTIVGGLIGAAVGHRIGLHHGGHDPGAVVGGTLIGAVIGNSIGEGRAERRGEYQPVGYDAVRRCQVSYRDEYEERIDGYRVTYLYHGREYTTRMPYDPGDRIRVNVDIRPEY